MNSITLNAPAKINLYLDIIRKRPDGYHDIETIFQKIGLHDRIKVSVVGRGIHVECRHPHLPVQRANLAYRAADLLRRESGYDKGVRIQIRKRIPVAAGLGGGSSDAASVLTAINRLFKLDIPNRRLISLAGTIGADVPFFVSGFNCATGRGVGDKLKELKPQSKSYVLLLIPNLRIYTKTIYNRVSFPLTKRSPGVNIIARILSGARITERGNFLYNILEDVVLPAYPIVRKGREILSLYTDRVLLSGSGPSLFALFDRRKEALKAINGIKKDGRWQLILTETV